jgi:hypothetical protein
MSKRKLDESSSDKYEKISRRKKNDLVRCECSEDCDQLLRCFLTKQMYVIPTTLQCGHTFEMHAIREHTREKKECPICGKNVWSLEGFNKNITIIQIIYHIHPRYAIKKKEENPELYEEPQNTSSSLIDFDKRCKEQLKNMIGEMRFHINEELNKMAYEGVTSYYNKDIDSIQEWALRLKGNRIVFDTIKKELKMQNIEISVHDPFNKLEYLNLRLIKG